MEKLLLAAAIAALSVSTAQAAPTLYGKAFLTADYVNSELDVQTIGLNNNIDQEDSSLQINSNTSVLGLKGSEAITANTDVIYQLEYGIEIDDSGDDNIGFRSRDTYLGFTNKDYGQFRFGRNYSVTDYVNNVTLNEGYWDNIGASSLNEDNSLSDALTLTDGGRVNNSIVWIAPKYNDLPLELALQYGADEDFVSNDNDRDSGFGASLMFDPGTGFTAGVAYDKDMTIGGDILRGTASVDLGKYITYPITLGALYQQSDYEGLDKEKGLVVSAEMGIANFAHPAVIYLQYDTTDNLGGMENFDSNQLVVGGKYSYKDNIIAHAYVGQNSAELDTTNADVFAIGGGLEYLF